ncbi:MAG: tRNA lysidine(34) synthetase TilS [Acidobacteria bacterium]|nr:tRNA lysidine(34) synthetase TilS [Acidobacteriota bacterium]
MRHRDFILEQTQQTIERFGMLPPGRRLAVACSGGADSTALLLILHELAAQLGCVLSMAHLNHQLRGEESDEDERFVRELADRLGLPLRVERATVRAAARHQRTNLEATARQMRYRFLLSLLSEGWADRVAVGHTADDQAETVVHRFLRGAGTKGLAGIHPAVEGKIVRPLLQIRRAALREWLQAREQPWREDASNQDLRLSRNRIRHQLWPHLCRLNPGLVETLSDMADIAREEETFWQDFLVALIAQSTHQQESRIVLDADRLRQLPVAVARRLLRWAVARAGQISETSPSPAIAPTSPWLDVLAGSGDYHQIERLLELARQSQSGTTAPLAHGLVARREFNRLILEKASSNRAPAQDYCQQFRVPALVEVPEIERRFSFKLVPLVSVEARYNVKEGVLLDGRWAESTLTLRNWRPGDAYQPRGHWKPSKLKEFFQRKRISRSERQGWPVLVLGQQIVWARGLEVGEGFSPPPGSPLAILIEESLL